MSLAWHPFQEGVLAFGTEDGKVGFWHFVRSNLCVEHCGVALVFVLVTVLLTLVRLLSTPTFLDGNVVRRETIDRAPS